MAKSSDERRQFFEKKRWPKSKFSLGQDSGRLHVGEARAICCWAAMHAVAPDQPSAPTARPMAPRAAHVISANNMLYVFSNSLNKFCSWCNPQLRAC